MLYNSEKSKELSTKLSTELQDELKKCNTDILLQIEIKSSPEFKLYNPFLATELTCAFREKLVTDWGPWFDKLATLFKEIQTPDDITFFDTLLKTLGSIVSNNASFWNAVTYCLIQYSYEDKHVTVLDKVISKLDEQSTTAAKSSTTPGKNRSDTLLTKLYKAEYLYHWQAMQAFIVTLYKHYEYIAKNFKKIAHHIEKKQTTLADNCMAATTAILSKILEHIQQTLSSTAFPRFLLKRLSSETLLQAKSGYFFLRFMGYTNIEFSEQIIDETTKQLFVRGYANAFMKVANALESDEVTPTAKTPHSESEAEIYTYNKMFAAICEHREEIIDILNTDPKTIPEIVPSKTDDVKTIESKKCQPSKMISPTELTPVSSKPTSRLIEASSALIKIFKCPPPVNWGAIKAWMETYQDCLPQLDEFIKQTVLQSSSNTLIELNSLESATAISLGRNKIIDILNTMSKGLPEIVLSKTYDVKTIESKKCQPSKMISPTELTPDSSRVIEASSALIKIFKCPPPVNWGAIKAWMETYQDCLHQLLHVSYKNRNIYYYIAELVDDTDTIKKEVMAAVFKTLANKQRLIPLLITYYSPTRQALIDSYFNAMKEAASPDVIFILLLSAIAQQDNLLATQCLKKLGDNPKALIRFILHLGEILPANNLLCTKIYTKYLDRPLIAYLLIAAVRHNNAEFYQEILSHYRLPSKELVFAASSELMRFNLLPESMSKLSPLFEEFSEDLTEVLQAKTGAERLKQFIVLHNRLEESCLKSPSESTELKNQFRNRLKHHMLNFCWDYFFSHKETKVSSFEDLWKANNFYNMKSILTQHCLATQENFNELFELIKAIIATDKWDKNIVFNQIVTIFLTILQLHRFDPREQKKLSTPTASPRFFHSFLKKKSLSDTSLTQLKPESECQAAKLELKKVKAHKGLCLDDVIKQIQSKEFVKDFFNSGSLKTKLLLLNVLPLKAQKAVLSSYGELMKDSSVIKMFNSANALLKDDDQKNKTYYKKNRDSITWPIASSLDETEIHYCCCRLLVAYNQILYIATDSSHNLIKPLNRAALEFLGDTFNWLLTNIKDHSIKTTLSDMQQTFANNIFRKLLNTRIIYKRNYFINAMMYIAPNETKMVILCWLRDVEYPLKPLEKLHQLEPLRKLHQLLKGDGSTAVDNTNKRVVAQFIGLCIKILEERYEDEFRPYLLQLASYLTIEDAGKLLASYCVYGRHDSDFFKIILHFKDPNSPSKVLEFLKTINANANKTLEGVVAENLGWLRDALKEKFSNDEDKLAILNSMVFEEKTSTTTLSPS